jgi:hypothetical protein
VVVALHDGVDVADGLARDRATRRTIRLSHADAGPVLLGHGLARLDLPVSAVLRACLGGRTYWPVRLVRQVFRRRLPGRGVLAVVRSVGSAAALPAMAIAVLFLGSALTVGLLAGAVGELLGPAILGIATMWVSLIAHESAHLLVLRAVEHDHTIGAVAHSIANVWIITPPMTPTCVQRVAVAGPLAGAAVCGVAGMAGAPLWLWAALAATHLANLLPWAPDGRALLARRSSQPRGTQSARSSTASTEAGASPGQPG